MQDRSQVVGPGCVQGLQVVAWSWCWQSCRFADNVGGWRRSQCAVTFGALADCPAAPCAHVKCHYAPNAPNDTIPRLDSVAFSMRARAAAPGHHQVRRLGQKPMTRLSPLLHGQQGMTLSWNSIKHAHIHVAYLCQPREIAGCAVLEWGLIALSSPTFDRFLGKYHEYIGETSPILYRVFGT